MSAGPHHFKASLWAGSAYFKSVNQQINRVAAQKKKSKFSGG